MEENIKLAQAERRSEQRAEATSHIGVRRVMPIMPISDAKVLNVSSLGVAITIFGTV